MISLQSQSRIIMVSKENLNEQFEKLLVYMAFCKFHANAAPD